MLKEAMEFLNNLATERAKLRVQKAPDCEPAHIYFLDGQKRWAEPPVRDHRASDLDAIIKFAAEFPTCTVWYCRDAVVCLFDDRRDKVTLPLRYSPQVVEIMSWGTASKPFGQRELILKLRTLFKQCLAQCPTLIDCLRTLKFKSGAESEVAIGKNRASVGRAIESMVSGPNELPDEVYFTVPIFDGPFRTMEAVLDVAIEADGGTEKITLHPVPGTLEQQIRLAEIAIGQQLAETIDAKRIFYGNPF